MNDAAGQVRIIGPESWGPGIDVIQGEGSWREIIGPRIGAKLRSMYAVTLSKGAATIFLKHPHEAVYYVIDGEVRIESSTNASETIPEGGMIHIRAYTDYRLFAEADANIIGGPAPVDITFGTPAAAVPLPEAGVPGEVGVRVFHRDRPGLMVPMISADARLVIWYGEGAVGANMNYVVLEPGERNTEHVHVYSEDTIYILEGRGTAEDVTNSLALEFGPGDAVHIPPGVIHAIAADRGERVVTAGGPCPADLDMLRMAGVDVDALTAAMEFA